MPILSSLAIACARAYGFGGFVQQFFVETITFNGSATWTCPTGVTEIEYLVVAGGAGGGGGRGSGDAGAGGGAGGFRTGTGLSVTAGTTYTITVGAGGTKGTLTRGTNGGDSSIAGSPITESPSGAGTKTFKSYWWG